MYHLHIGGGALLLLGAVAGYTMASRPTTSAETFQRVAQSAQAAGMPAGHPLSIAGNMVGGMVGLASRFHVDERFRAMGPGCQQGWTEFGSTNNVYMHRLPGQLSDPSLHREISQLGLATCAVFTLPAASVLDPAALPVPGINFDPTAVDPNALAAPETPSAATGPTATGPTAPPRPSPTLGVSPF